MTWQLAAGTIVIVAAIGLISFARQIRRAGDPDWLDEGPLPMDSDEVWSSIQDRMVRGEIEELERLYQLEAGKCEERRRA